MKRPKIPHVEAIKRAIHSKRMALVNRSVSPTIHREVNNDIRLLQEVITFLYQAIDRATLFSG